MKPIDYFLDKCNRIDEGNGFIADEKFYKAIDEYSIQLCKEQRISCADEGVENGVTKLQFDKILNAPLPDL